LPAVAAVAAVERRLGAALLRLRGERLFRSLGFVRLSDYVTERLGLSHRTAQELMRVEEALSTLPAIAAVFEEGTLTSSHVRILARVAIPEAESYWLALARRSSVRELAEAAGAQSTGTPPARETTANEAPAREASEAAWLQIDAPAWMAALWRDTVALVRRLVGAEATAGECLEVVLAEFGAGAGVEWSAASDPYAARTIETETAVDSGDRDMHASARSFTSTAAITATAATVAPRAPAGDARAVDRELRDLVCLRQRHEAALAAHLLGVGRERTYRVDGFASLEDYAHGRFGLSPRRLYYLLALHRTLEALPRLQASFFEGRLTLRQAILVGSVATVRTEASWIERAAGVTLRRLEDEIALWRQLKDSRPQVWRRLDGGPIPPGIALVPGTPPRLHASAPPDAVAFVRALEEDAASEPLPERMVRIRMRAAPEVIAMWRDVVAWGRERGGGASLREWEVLALCLRDFFRTWDNAETRRQRRENPTLERDGWRCTAPGCRSMGSGRLHEHHVVFRSAGGAAKDPANLTTLCVGHHLGLLHEGKIRCSGQAPDDLRWEMGVERGREAFLVYRGESVSAL